MFIILELELNLIAIDTACCIDLIYSQLCTVLYSHSIYSRAACNRADPADLKYLRRFTSALRVLLKRNFPQLLSRLPNLRRRLMKLPLLPQVLRIKVFFS